MLPSLRLSKSSCKQHRPYRPARPTSCNSARCQCLVGPAFFPDIRCRYVGLFKTAAADSKEPGAVDSSNSYQLPVDSERSAAAGSPFSDLTSPDSAVPTATVPTATVPEAGEPPPEGTARQSSITCCNVMARCLHEELKLVGASARTSSTEHVVHGCPLTTQRCL